jgi:hypothetical protein
VTAASGEALLSARPQGPGDAAADVDADGKPNLKTASVGRHGFVSVLFNDGRGRVHRGRALPATGASALAVTTCDVNRDGIIDILTASLGRRDPAVLLGQGGGRFGDAIRVRGGDGGGDLDVCDFKGDRYVDVATASRGHVVTIRLGNGDGTFGPKTTYAAGRCRHRRRPRA